MKIEFHVELNFNNIEIHGQKMPCNAAFLCKKPHMELNIYKIELCNFLSYVVFGQFSQRKVINAKNDNADVTGYSR